MGTNEAVHSETSALKFSHSKRNRQSIGTRLAGNLAKNQIITRKIGPSSAGRADLPGDDLILCQITSQARSDGLSVPLTVTEFQRGRLAVDSFVRPHRLF